MIFLFVVFEQCSVVIFTENPTMNFRWLSEWVWSTILWLNYPWVQNNYNRPLVDAGIVTYVEEQAHGDAGDMVQLHPWWKVHTRGQSSRKCTWICFIYVHLQRILMSVIDINGGNMHAISCACNCCLCNSSDNLEHRVPKAKRCPD